MLGGMDWLTILASLADALGILGAATMQALAERLLTLLLIGLLLSGVASFACAALARVCAERIASRLRLRLTPAPR
jgi:hypothetical protein